jgi:hypothetical protein
MDNQQKDYKIKHQLEEFDKKVNYFVKNNKGLCIALLLTGIGCLLSIIFSEPSKVFLHPIGVIITIMGWYFFGRFFLFLKKNIGLGKVTAITITFFNFISIEKNYKIFGNFSQLLNWTKLDKLNLLVILFAVLMIPFFYSLLIKIARNIEQDNKTNYIKISAYILSIFVTFVYTNIFISALIEAPRFF